MDAQSSVIERTRLADRPGAQTTQGDRTREDGDSRVLSEGIEPPLRASRGSVVIGTIEADFHGSAQRKVRAELDRRGPTGVVPLAEGPLLAVVQWLFVFSGKVRPVITDDPSLEPALRVMAMDILTNVLRSADSPGQLGRYVTEEIRSLTGAQCVVLTRLPGPDTPCHVVSANPARRLRWAKSPTALGLHALVPQLSRAVLIDGQEGTEISDHRRKDGCVLAVEACGQYRAPRRGYFWSRSSVPFQTESRLRQSGSSSRDN